MIAPLARFTLLPLAGAIALGAILLGSGESRAGQSPGAEGLIGSWRALDAGSDFLKQIDVVVEGDAVSMDLWPSISGGRGPRATRVLLPLAAVRARALTAADPAVEAERDYGFKTERYAIKLTGGGLRLGVAIRYTDRSGRHDRSADFHFVRGTYGDAAAPPTSAEGAVADEGRGWLGVWSNIDRGSRGALEIRIRDVGNIVMSVWGRKGVAISQAPIGSVVLPIDREAAVAGQVGSTVEATADHGFAKTTYRLLMGSGDRIRLTESRDYVDPRREDHRFVWTFVRGEFPRE